MNDAEVLATVMLMLAGFTTLLWIRAELQRRRAEKRLWALLGEQEEGGLARRQTVMPAARRVDQLEAQLDQVVQQIDRLAESQEFLSRVLTDRIDQLPDPRLRTPH